MEKYLFWEYDQRDGIADLVRNGAKFFGGAGEGFGDGLIFYSRAKLYEEGEALSRYLRRVSGEASPSVSLFGGGMYDTATVLVAAAILGSPLTLSDGEPDGECGGVIVIARSSTCYNGKGRFVATEEMSAAILGELAERSYEKKGRPIGRRGLTVGFMTKNGEVERYDEETLLTVADAYAKALGLMPWDAVMSTLSPSSREGFFGGLLAPMLRAARWIYSPEDETLFEQMRLASPTRLISLSSAACAIAGELERLKDEPSMWRRGRGSHPTRRIIEKIDPLRETARGGYARYRFGGRLRGVATFGQINEESESSLLAAGISVISLLSADGCALAGFRRSRDREGIWRLPRYLIADMRDVTQGGYGRLVYFGGGLPIGFDETGREHPAISSFFGFPTGKGRIFVEKGRSL